MPGLALLARFCNGGRIIATTVVLVGVCGRRHLHSLHMRTVFASHHHTRTRLKRQ
jgi:hypothetical protein